MLKYSLEHQDILTLVYLLISNWIGAVKYPPHFQLFSHSLFQVAKSIKKTQICVTLKVQIKTKMREQYYESYNS
jgi:hypothetical protein